MKNNKFLDLVPRPFKRAAWAVAACFFVGALAFAGFHAMNGPVWPHAPANRTLAVAQGIALVMLAASVFSTWVLCLGYVHADARRRAMPPWLWTLVAAFIPNLLGFLLYFACRRPIAVPCPHCGQPTAPDQRYCSWCGHLASGPLASGGSLA